MKFKILFLWSLCFLTGCSVQVGQLPTLHKTPAGSGRTTTKTPIPPSHKPPVRQPPVRKPPISPKPPQLDPIFCNAQPPALKMHLHLWQGVTIPERCQLQGRTTTSSSNKTELRRDGEQWVLEITQANRSPWIQSRLRLDKNGRIIERRDFNASHELINLHSVRWDETGNLLEHTNRRFYKGKERTPATATS